MIDITLRPHKLILFALFVPSRQVVDRLTVCPSAPAFIVETWPVVALIAEGLADALPFLHSLPSNPPSGTPLQGHNSDKFLTSCSTSNKMLSLDILRRHLIGRSFCMKIEALPPRPPTGLRGFKAWRFVSQQQQKQNQNNDVPEDSKKDGTSLESITGKFARPLLPLPGEGAVEDSWQDITRAPVAMQVEEVLGNRSSGYGSQDRMLERSLGHEEAELSASSSSLRSLLQSLVTEDEDRLTAAEDTTLFGEDPLHNTSSRLSISAADDDDEHDNDGDLLGQDDDPLADVAPITVARANANGSSITIRSHRSSEMITPSSSLTSLTDVDEVVRQKYSGIVYFSGTY